MPVADEFMETLEALKNALSHTHAGASLKELFLHCMKVTLRQHERRAKAKVDKPRGPKADQPPPKGRHTPASVKREVDERDHGQCTFVGEDGRVCGTRFLIQYHHESDPHAFGGAATAANLTLHCKAHNDLKARRVFGEAHMDQFTRREKPKTLEPPLPEPLD
jgi:hypothetical protein